MKRGAVLAAVSLLVVLIQSPSAVANPPVRFPTANQPVDFAAGLVCPFPIRAVPVVDREVTTLHFDSHGDLRWIGVTGFLSIRVTNTDSGRSLLVNISGPGKFTFRPDGTVVLKATGNWLLFQRSFDNPPNQLLLNSGHVVLAISPNPPGPATIVHRTGSSRDLCPVLA
jgi:hypothetical protein